MEILNSKESDLGISQLESFFKVENDALIDCLAFDNSKKILDAVKNSLRTNVTKLAQLTQSLVNVERFQRLQVEQESDKIQEKLDQWKQRLNQQTKDWIEYREKVTKMTSKEMQNWLADESRILDRANLNK